MGLFDSLRRNLNKPKSPSDQTPQEPAPRRSRPEEVRVPEVTVLELLPLHRQNAAPALLDCREPYEWAQMRIPRSLHIPMSQIPGRLADLDPDQEWVVVCAHGNRSFAVAGYLISNGYRASSLAGGVTDWWMRGGDTESDLGTPPRPSFPGR